MADRLGTPHRHRRHAIVAVQAAQLLDHVRFHGDVVAPGRRRHAPGLLALPRNAEAERAQMAFHDLRLQGDPGQPLELIEPEGERPWRRRQRSGHDRRAGLAAAQLEDQPGGIFHARQDHGRVDAALEAGARVALDAKPASARRGALGIEQGDLEHHVGGGLGASGASTAHDAAEADHAGAVGDHRDRRIELVGVAIQRQQPFAGPREAQDDVAAQLGRIEHVQRPAEVHGDEVGDVDQGGDRAQPDRGEALLQPGRARPVGHAPEDAADEQRARRLVARGKRRA